MKARISKKNDTEIVVTDDQLPADVLQAIEAGNKVVAIKRLREATGLGLANAKVLVDRAASRHARNNPQLKGLQEESKSGSLAVVLVLLVAAYLAYRYFLTP